jgi:hypothetical protein
VRSGKGCDGAIGNSVDMFFIGESNDRAIEVGRN